MGIPYCSHNGFFTECTNDMHRPMKMKKGFRHDEGERAIFAGHLAYLKKLGCKEDATHLKRMLDEAQKTHAHFVLPDNVTSFLDLKAMGEMDIKMLARWPHEQQTVSWLDQGIRQMVYVTREKSRWTQDDDGPVFIAYPMSKIDTTYFADTFPGWDLPTNPTYQQVMSNKVVQEKLSIDNMAGLLSWTPNTFCARLTEQGLQVHDWQIESEVFVRSPQNEASRKLAMDQVSRLIATFLYLWHQPATDAQWDYDPDWVSDKATYTDKRKYGFKDSVRPTKVRLYVPRLNRPTVAPDPNHKPDPRGPQQQHIRSGHWRHYKNGRRVWINNYVAGDPSVGSLITQPKTIELVPRR